MREVSLKFNNGFNGELNATRADVAVGMEEGMLEPYDMLLGALCSCLYSTVLDEFESRKISVDEADMTVNAVHREVIPTTLKEVNIMIALKGISDESLAEFAVDEATKNCSIYQTVANVAEMTTKVTFV